MSKKIEENQAPKELTELEQLQLNIDLIHSMLKEFKDGANLPYETRAALFEGAFALSSRCRCTACVVAMTVGLKFAVKLEKERTKQNLEQQAEPQQLPVRNAVTELMNYKAAGKQVN